MQTPEVRARARARARPRKVANLGISSSQGSVGAFADVSTEFAVGTTNHVPTEIPVETSAKARRTD